MLKNKDILDEKDKSDVLHTISEEVSFPMSDSDKIGGDGFPIQEYTLHFLPAIYPDESKTVKENMEIMKDKNYEMWKEVYETTYGIPLTYSCDSAE